MKDTEKFKKQTGPHDIALEDVIDRLFKAGCVSAKIGVENMKFSDEATKMIRGDPFNMRWLRVRGFPDLDIFPQKLDIETFYLDVKTIQNRDRIAYPEAFPWADSIERTVFKAKRTLYVYYLQNNDGTTTRKCFFSDDHSVIDCIFDTIYRKVKPLPMEAELMIQNYLNRTVKMIDKPPPYGVSGDCCAMIHEKDLLQCKDFDEFIKIHLLS